MLYNIYNEEKFMHDIVNKCYKGAKEEKRGDRMQVGIVYTGMESFSIVAMLEWFLDTKKKKGDMLMLE